jgi:hypothetical protein
VKDENGDVCRFRQYFELAEELHLSVFEVYRVSDVKGNGKAIPVTSRGGP